VQTRLNGSKNKALTKRRRKRQKGVQIEGSDCGQAKIVLLCCWCKKEVQHQSIFEAYIVLFSNQLLVQRRRFETSLILQSLHSAFRNQLLVQRRSYETSLIFS